MSGNKLELGSRNFKVDSTSWEKAKITDISGAIREFFVNPQGDIWQIIGGEAEGEQLFTWKAASRETKKAGKRMPTDKEFTNLLKTIADIPNFIPAGYRPSSSGSFNSQGKCAFFWTSTSAAGSLFRTARFRYLSPDLGRVDRGEENKAYGFSVRCLLP